MMERTRVHTRHATCRARAIALLPFAVLLATGCSGGSGGGKPVPYPVETIADIPYAGDDDPRHLLDVYTPVGVEHPTVVFFVPGGAWTTGDKNQYGELGATFAGTYGYTVAVTNYRLSNPEDGQAVFPDHIEDVAAAFAWVKGNIAGYGGSPDRIFVFGQSAGAHLASLLATDGTWLEARGCATSDVAALVSMSGLYDLGDLVVSPGNPLGLTADEVVMYKAMMLNAFGGWGPAELRPASPAAHIDASQPAFLVIYVENDLPGFAPEAENFVDRVAALAGPEVTPERLFRSDFSDETWAVATEMAAQQPPISDYVGHYAEIVAINTKEADSRSTRLVVDFIESHDPD